MMEREHQMNPYEYYQKQLKKSQATPSPIACYEVGRCLEIGYGTNIDKPEAETWYQLAFHHEGLSTIRSLANEGETQAQFILGRIHVKGQAGVSKNDTEAAKWFHKAVEQGYAEAQSNLGFIV
jgi:TPR repeat protein